MSSLIFWPPLLVPAAAGLFILMSKPKRAGELAVLSLLLTCLLSLTAGIFGGLSRLSITEAVWIILRLDKLGLFFLAIITLAFLAALVYSIEYIGRDKKRHVFYGFSLLTCCAMVGLCMAGNLITFYMFFELMSLMSFPLVLYNGGEEANMAAMKYLGFSVFGASMVLMGMMLGGGLTLRSFGMETFESLTLKHQWAFFLIAVGFSCKAGMLPLSNWLPTAHPVAPAPASALLSGIITKAGVLGIIRSAYYIFGAQAVAHSFGRDIMLWLSVATIFTGSMLAYKEKHLKKRLAYSSVSQLSYVIFGLMLCNPMAFEGALLQVLFHACAKVGLFLCAGAFIHHCGTNYVDELKGMGLRMPRVMAAFTCFSLSLIGIPPFGGFIAKWRLASGALIDGGPAAQAGAVLLMVSALLTAGYLLPIVSSAYFPGHGYKVKKTDAGLHMYVPLVLLALAAAVLGVFPAGLGNFIAGISAALF